MITSLPLVFILGMITGLLSTLSGGGGGLLSTPLLLLLGLSTDSAIATGKCAAIGLTLGALSRYHRTPHIRASDLAYFAGLSIAAAVCGARLTLAIPDAVAVRAVALTILASIPFLLHAPSSFRNTRPSELHMVLGYVLYFVVLVVQAAFGSGAGLLALPVMVHLLGYTPLEATATRRLPALLLAVTALTAYWSAGAVFPLLGAAMFAGALIGGRVGATLTLLWSPVFILRFTAITAAVISATLLLV